MAKIYGFLTIFSILGLGKGTVKQPPSPPSVKNQYTVKVNIDKKLPSKEDSLFWTNENWSIIIQPPVCASCFR